MKLVARSVLVGLTVLSAYAQEPSAKGVNFYSLAWEVQIGQEEAGTLMRTLPIVHEPKVDAYLDSLTAELAKYAGSRFTYSFTVYEDRKPVGIERIALHMPVDAFQGRAAEPVALPGGPILAPLSLLADAPDEAALVFQLAHAMAHVALRHSTRLATRQELQSIAAIPLQAQNAAVPVALAIHTSGQIAMQAGFLTFARHLELAADTLAAGIMAQAGYNPETVAPYLEGLRPPDGVRESKFFSAHPTVERRVEAVRGKVEKLPPSVYRALTGGFEEVKALAASVR